MQVPTNHRAIDPKTFRDQATGTSPCREESAEEGAARAARVVECMPAAVKRAVAPAQGYALGARAPAAETAADEAREHRG